MTEQKEIKGAYVRCRRWFDKINSNTYHDVTIQYRKGNTDFVNMTYGYGEQCFQTAKEFLLENGILDNKYKNVPFWKIAKELDIETSIYDVNKKSELNNY